jgi:hypothetical protein
MKKQKQMSPGQKYKMWLDSFYNMRSELKFKGYELNLVRELNLPGFYVVLKELITDKEYKCHISNTCWLSADEFIQQVKMAYGDNSLKMF